MMDERQTPAFGVSMLPRGVIVALIVTALLILGLVSSAFVVRVDQYALVIQFGKPVRTETEPGLYFRIPGIQSVRYLDRRILEWDDSPQEMITKDKKRIYINSFARWQIEEPKQYYTVVKTEDVAQLNLDKLLGRAVRDEVSRHVLDEVVRDTDRVLTYSTEIAEKQEKVFAWREGRGRSALTRRVYEGAVKQLADSFGIQLIDFQIKELNYTESAQRETIKEMISERMVVVERYEAEGKAKREQILGDIEEILQGLQADANQQRFALEGEGQAKAIEIKSLAFGQDPQLYQFLETLQLYERSFDANTTLVLSTDHPMLALLSGPGSLGLPFIAADERLTHEQLGIQIIKTEERKPARERWRSPADEDAAAAEVETPASVEEPAP